MTESVTRSRRMLLLLMALFMLPLAFAFVAYYSGWRPAGNTNHGELLQPIRQLPALSRSRSRASGRWPMWAMAPATTDCQTALVFARQTRLSLAADTARVNWVLLATDQLLQPRIPRQPRTRASSSSMPPPSATALLAVLPTKDLPQSLFVIDPLGNIVLRFDVRENPRGLLEDMKKLLKLSHIG